MKTIRIFLLKIRAKIALLYGDLWTSVICEMDIDQIRKTQVASKLSKNFQCSVGGSEGAE